MRTLHVLCFLHAFPKHLLPVTVKILDTRLHTFSVWFNGALLTQNKLQLRNLKRNAYLAEEHQISFAHLPEPCCIQSSPPEPVEQPLSECHFAFCHIHLLQLYFPHAYLQYLQQNIADISIQIILSCYMCTEATKAQKNNLGYTCLFTVTLFSVRLQSYIQLLLSVYLLSKHCSVPVIFLNVNQQLYILYSNFRKWYHNYFLSMLPFK